MITIEECITVTHDEPLVKDYRIRLNEKDGWQISEDTVAVTFKRVQWFGFLKGETE